MEVADLEAEHERGQGVDPAEAAQPGDGRPPLGLEREPGEALIERGLARRQPVDGRERVEERQLGSGLVEPLPSKPLPVTDVQVSPPDTRSRAAGAASRPGGGSASDPSAPAHAPAEMAGRLDLPAGTATVFSCPASNSRASSSASCGRS